MAKKKVSPKVWNKCRDAAKAHGHIGENADEVASKIYETLTRRDHFFLAHDIEKTPFVKEE